MRENKIVKLEERCTGSLLLPVILIEIGEGSGLSICTKDYGLQESSRDGPCRQ